MIVVDTNVVVSYLIPGAMTRAAEGVRTRESVWIAPRLLRSEMLNTLAKYVVVAQTIDRDRALRTFRRAMGLVHLDEQDSEALDVLNTCVKSGITSYDAEFVALAVRENARLVTRDQGNIACISQPGDQYCRLCCGPVAVSNPMISHRY